jgi:hypothetical protein
VVLVTVRSRFGDALLLHVALGLKGLLVNHKKLRRLTMRNGYKFAVAVVLYTGARHESILALPQDPNQHWSLDFIHD